MVRNVKNHGFTLIEATLAMVMLAVAAAGVLLPFANAAAVQVEGARQTLAANLATELMEKVLLSEPNAIIGTYDGYAETAGAMLDTAGSLRTGAIYDGFSRSVSCQTATVASVDLVAVTVAVAYQNNEMTRVTTLVGD